MFRSSFSITVLKANTSVELDKLNVSLYTEEILTFPEGVLLIFSFTLSQLGMVKSLVAGYVLAIKFSGSEVF